ncbi:MAG: cobalamin ABC transporter ATP-binding protein [Acidobacteria bacterium]|nr:MAG: cobalamin ABC transporter ATP-binding protein [Acidobacteriota bacterium]
MSTILEFCNVGFARRERSIFSDLSFSVEHGEMVALMGPNGVGKTTLLNLASGLLCPSSGEILVQGRAVRAWGRRQLSCCVALVPQHLEVPFAFRVEEIVAQGRTPHLSFFGGISSRDSEIIENAMEAVDILKMRNRIFSELSGGERQRVKIAIGLAQQPKLMLLDEPTQHLDLGRQIELMDLLRRLNERGITIMAAVHDLALVRESFSKAILLTPDAPAMTGAAKELLQADLLERAFSVERAGLDRYLSIDPMPIDQAASSVIPELDIIDDSEGSQRKKSGWQEYREKPWRPGEQLTERNCRRYPQNLRGAHHRDKD